MEEPTLDCQACGAVVMKLTPAQARVVASNPYNYIVFCREHREEGF